MITIPSLAAFLNPGKFGNMCGIPATSCPPATDSASAAQNTAGSRIPNGSEHNLAAVPSSASSQQAYSSGFQMPLHYPRFKKADYEKMAEPQLDCLLREYGLPTTGDVNQKRKFAMGAFLWPDQY